MIRIHPTADVSPRATIGEGASIWHQCQVREGATIGPESILGKNVYVDFDVCIGSRVKIQNNCSVYHGATIEDGVFLGPHVVLTNDLYPRAINPDGTLKGNDDWEVGPIRICYGASIGARSVVLPGRDRGPVRAGRCGCGRDSRRACLRAGGRCAGPACGVRVCVWPPARACAAKTGGLAWPAPAAAPSMPTRLSLSRRRTRTNWKPSSSCIHKRNRIADGAESTRALGSRESTPICVIPILSVPNMEEPMLNVGVIGVGSMGRNHARVFAQMPETNLAAVADCDGEASHNIARTYKANAYTDFCQMLERERLDIVSVAVPTRLHAEVTLEAIRHGVHVFVEKPLAFTLPECQAMIDAARQAGVGLGVGHIERFNPAILELKRRLAAGELGRVFQIRSRRVGPFPSRIADVGVVFDLATHELNIMEYLIGAPIENLYAETEQEIHATATKTCSPGC